MAKVKMNHERGDDAANYEEVEEPKGWSVFASDL